MTANALTLRPSARHAGTLASMLLALALSTSSMSVSAQARKQPNGLSWGELAMLPEYCQDANGIVWGDRYYNRSPNAGRWEAAMGLDFWHVHHYCYALNNLQRANFTADAQKKRFLLQKVRGDLTYMINNSSPSMVLMPEIWTRMGDVERLLGNVGQALEAYETAIARKPNYWPPYLNAADMFLAAGLKPRALDFLQRGLAANPGATQLRERYKSAGGDTNRLSSAPPPDMQAAAASAPEATASAASSP